MTLGNALMNLAERTPLRNVLPLPVPAMNKLILLGLL